MTSKPPIPLQAASNLTDVLSAATGGKVLIVPSAQAGRKVLTNWARRGIATMGIRAFTPLGFAEAVLNEASPDKTIPRLPDLNQVLALDAVLDEFEFRKLEALGWSGERLIRSIRQMRVGGVGPDEYRKAGEGKLAREVSQVLDAYEKWLYRNGAIDEAEQFARAEMTRGKARPPSLLAVLSETPITASAAAFLRAMSHVASRSLLLEMGSGTPEEPTAGTAALVFQDWETVSPPSRPSADVKLVRVPAVEEEARFVLEEIERREVALDRAEIAYPRHTPYLPLILGEAARRGIPVTSAAGTPLSDLPAGQALRLFLAWLSAGQDSTALIRLLRSGFVRLPDSTTAHGVVAHLIQFHVAGDRKAYRRAFSGLRAPVDEEVRVAQGTEHHGRANARLKRLREAERAVDRLFDMVPGPDDTVREFAARLQRFVETFVPERGSPESTASKGRSELLSRLTQIQGGPDSSHSSDHLVSRFSQWLGTVIVHARLDAPGALHVTPLDSAGLSGRPELFVLGLDSASFLPSPVEDVFLPDTFCAQWEGGSGPLTSEQRVEARRHALKRAIGRTPERVTVVVAEGRIADDSDAGPASMFIELEAEYGPAGRVRVAQGFGPTRAVIRHRGTRPGDVLLDHYFPEVALGRQATRARASSDFTAYDAFVGSRPIVQQALAEPLSPSKLQELATCPFLYFQNRVLGVPNLEERRPGEWMTALENGKLVHEALNRFNQKIIAGDADPRDEDLLKRLLEEEFKSFRKGNEPPSEFVWRKRMRELARIAKVVTAEQRQVVVAELGFGQPTHRVQTEKDHAGELPLTLGSTRILLRGRIDVVERLPRGLVITDYKTGRSDAYDETGLLDNGKRLQWVLYAYAYEDLTGEQVDESGYLFVSGDAAGQTAYGKPLEREDVGELLGGLLGLAAEGRFPASADPARGTHCQWCDYRRVCGDLAQRRGEIRGKLDGLVEPAGDGAGLSVVPDFVDAWPYARKYLKR